MFHIIASSGRCNVKCPVTIQRQDIPLLLPFFGLLFVAEKSYAEVGTEINTSGVVHLCGPPWVPLSDVFHIQKTVVMCMSEGRTSDNFLGDHGDGKSQSKIQQKIIFI